jgi:Ca2+-binding EF-hand superfamily protein
MHPEYSLALKKMQTIQNKTTENGSSNFDTKQIIKKIIDKITQQWKSIKTAFTKINSEKKRFIDKTELEIALNNLGFFLDSETLDIIYKEFDYDKDGQISYQDFKTTIGQKIQPEEFLYFRQDNPSTIVLKPHEQKNCWKELPNVS